MQQIAAVQVRAEIVDGPEVIFAESDLIVKVKEPQPAELPLLKRGQTVFTYFHFAADEELTRRVLDTGITAVAYETLRGPKGDLPCLTPMSEVAGRMSIQEGAKYLERPQEGRGILLGGVWYDIGSHAAYQAVVDAWRRKAGSAAGPHRP